MSFLSTFAPGTLNHAPPCPSLVRVTGGPAYGSSSEGATELRDLFVAILPGAEARVGGEGGKKKSGLFRKSKATGGDETAIYVPSSIVIKVSHHACMREGPVLAHR
jgi:hypothetical protein